MIKRTPRPRRKSSATFNSPMTRAKSNGSMAVPSSWKGAKKDDDNESVISDYGTLLDKDDSMDEKLLEGDGSESDSSIDIHTPLPYVLNFVSLRPTVPLTAAVGQAFDVQRWAAFPAVEAAPGWRIGDAVVVSGRR